jgi:TonB family protein
LETEGDEVSSATDLKEKDGAKADGQDAGPCTRPNPIALEVPVSVTWAKPARPNEKRDLFSEETVTVLVFRDGAVIQLSAAITLGQLLFLTHKKSKREMVCQVVQKRNFKPTSCFVELEFTEEAENFWGVTFPAKEVGAQPPPIAQAVAEEETTEEDRGEPVAAPKSEDVAQLKDEVQTLRKQLQELKDKQAAEEEQAAEEKKAAEEQEAAAKRQAEEQAQTQGQSEATKNEEPPVTEPAPVRRRIGMKLPSLSTTLEAPAAPTEAPKAAHVPGGGLAFGRKEEAQELDEIDDLLPRPALDFSKAKAVDPNDPFNIYKPVRRAPGKLEKTAGAALGALLLVALVAAWSMNRLPFLRRAPKTGVTANSAPVAPPAAPAEVPVRAPNAAATSAPEIPGTPSASATENTEAAAPVSAAKAEEPVVKKAAPAAKAASGGTYVSAKVSRNRGKAVTSTESNPQPAAEVVRDETVIPAKLLHSVSPIYPPDAMRHYITGDVRLEAQVDAQGRVGAMNIIFGPAAFRQAAMDAMRQYEYAPATQGGKPVASKVVVTVKFWFDP